MTQKSHYRIIRQSYAFAGPWLPNPFRGTVTYTVTCFHTRRQLLLACQPHCSIKRRSEHTLNFACGRLIYIETLKWLLCHLPASLRVRTHCAPRGSPPLQTRHESPPSAAHACLHIRRDMLTLACHLDTLLSCDIARAHSPDTCHLQPGAKIFTRLRVSKKLLRVIIKNLVLRSSGFYPESTRIH